MIFILHICSHLRDQSDLKLRVRVRTESYFSLWSDAYFFQHLQRTHLGVLKH